MRATSRSERECAMCRHKADSYQDRNHREVQGLMRSSGLPEEVCYTLLYPDREEHTVDIVKQHLRTSEQKAWLDAHDLSVEDLLNGRYGGGDEPGGGARYCGCRAEIRREKCWTPRRTHSAPHRTNRIRRLP